MVGHKSGPTTLRSQEFKGEGHSLSGPEGLTIVCQLMKVWGMKDQRPTFPKQFLLCSLRVCKAHVLPVLATGRGETSGQGVPSAQAPSRGRWLSCCAGADPGDGGAWRAGAVPGVAPWGGVGLAHTLLLTAFGKTQEGEAGLAAHKCFLLL